MGTGLTFRCIYGIETRIPARFTLPYSIESRVTALPTKHVKLLYGPGIAFPGLARLRDIVDMVGLYNIYTDTEPPRARPGPSRPSSASGGPPAAARCGGVTNPTAEHRDAVGRSEAQLGVCGYHLDLSTGEPRKQTRLQRLLLRRRLQSLLLRLPQRSPRERRSPHARALRVRRSRARHPASE